MTDNQTVSITKRVTRRVRLDLEVNAADKLRDYAKAKGRHMSEVVEAFIETLG